MQAYMSLLTSLNVDSHMVPISQGSELRSYFVYPDSRAQLRDLFVMAGLVPSVVVSVHSTQGMPSSTAHVPHLPSSQLFGLDDFWSRSSGLNIAAFTEDMHQHKKEAKTF
jgi:hypothetical protein